MSDPAPAPPPLDHAKNRQAVKWSRSELLARALWEGFQPLWRLIPRPLFALRAQCLRGFGAKLGPHVHIYPTARIKIPWNLTVGAWSSIGDHAIIYNLGPITMGERVTVSQYAHLCAGSHDYRDPATPLLKPPIRIEAEAWVCADAFVGPGVTVGARAIVGARAVAIKDVPAGMIVGGNPARVLKARDQPL